MKWIRIMVWINFLIFSLWLCAPAYCLAAPASQEELVIVIDPQHNKLYVKRHQMIYKTYPIALGKPETPSPIGEWKVTTKQKNWGSGFGTRWIGLNVPWGTYGIHGTNRPSSIGIDASHGCIRMFNRHVEELYEMVKVGTPVMILGHPLGEPGQSPRRIARGDSGADVMLVQNRLKSAGIFYGACNGKFNLLTEQAVKQFEKSQGLQVDGVVGNLEYIRLGVME